MITIKAKKSSWKEEKVISLEGWDFLMGEQEFANWLQNDAVFDFNSNSLRRDRSSFYLENTRFCEGIYLALMSIYLEAHELIEEGTYYWMNTTENYLKIEYTENN